MTQLCRQHVYFQACEIRKHQHRFRRQLAQRNEQPFSMALRRYDIGGSVLVPAELSDQVKLHELMADAAMEEEMRLIPPSSMYRHPWQCGQRKPA